MDFRVIEENKRKYSDMLVTKLFLNEEEIIGLSNQSHKRVIIICPLCGRQRSVEYKKPFERGHTCCRNCSRSIKLMVSLFGKKKDRLLPYDFGGHYEINGTTFYKVKAICDCGVVKEYRTSEFQSSSRTKSCGCFNKEFAKARVGRLSPSWDPNISDEDRAKNRYGTDTWARVVKTRDGCCKVCGAKENLVAHHINSYRHNKELRLDIENGITLCRDCHTDFHVNFLGDYRVPCTSEDFEEYLMQV